MQNLGKIQTGSPLRGRQTEVGSIQIGDFQPTLRYISETVQDRVMVTTEH